MQDFLQKNKKRAAEAALSTFNFQLSIFNSNAGD